MANNRLRTHNVHPDNESATRCGQPLKHEDGSVFLEAVPDGQATCSSCCKHWVKQKGNDYWNHLIHTEWPERDRLKKERERAS